MTSFQVQFSAWQMMFFNMAEELQKYKDSLDLERKEFERQLEREVSTSWFCQIDQRNRILN